MITICKQLLLQETILNTNNLDVVIWFEVSKPTNTYDLYTIFWFLVTIPT